jgi:response regulator RpfG family c-di-GMP phosphodiesterase
MTVSERILIVDDDVTLLAGLVRRLGERFDIVAAKSGPSALDAVAKQGPFAAVLCDMRMPGMDGLEALRRFAEVAPDTVRMMLTGNADQKTAVDAINQGNIFRFFNKPVESAALADGIEAAIRQYRLVNAERQLLEETVAGGVALLADVLSLVAPEIFRQSRRIRPWAVAVARQMNLPDPWVVEMGAELSRLGAIAVPPEVLARHQTGQPLSQLEEEMVRHIPDLGAALIRKIPRLGPVAEAVQAQAQPFRGRAGQPPPPVAARILNALIALDEVGAGRPSREALSILRQEPERFDPVVLAALSDCLLETPTQEMGDAEIRLEVAGAELRVGDTLETDLRLETGRLVLAAGETIAELHFLRLQNLRRMSRLQEPIRIHRLARASRR